MKHALVFVGLALAVCTAACTRSLPIALSASSIVIVYDLSTKEERTLEPGSTGHVRLSAWVAANKRGWSQYLATPPSRGIRVQAPGLDLQLLDADVLATTRDGVFVKSIAPPDLSPVPARVSEQSGQRMATDPPQTFFPLTKADLARLSQQRALVERYLGNDSENLRKYETAAGKLGTIRAILDAGVLRADQTFELQCLGVVLGDAFVLVLGMEWVMAEDEYGRDPATRVPGTSIVVHPLTMVSKRIERGEVVDVFALFNAVADQVDEMRASGW